MPESMLEQVWSRVGLLGWAMIVSLSAWSAAGAAETLPASVRACAALTDSLQRLVCYDREVARYPEPAAKTPTKPEAAPAAGTAKSASAASAASAAKSASPPPASAASGATAPSSTSSTTAPTNTGAAAANDKAAATAADTGRISARVVTIDHQPNEMVLHLDNGQVWQQLQSVSGDLSLREGDTIKIEKHFGSYWLSGPHVSSMRVRQIS